jgi:hypothetical protein
MQVLIPNRVCSWLCKVVRACTMQPDDTNESKSRSVALSLHCAQSCFVMASDTRRGHTVLATSPTAGLLRTGRSIRISSTARMTLLITCSLSVALLGTSGNCATAPLSARQQSSTRPHSASATVPSVRDHTDAGDQAAESALDYLIRVATGPTETTSPVSSSASQTGRSGGGQPTRLTRGEDNAGAAWVREVSADEAAEWVQVATTSQLFSGDGDSLMTVPWEESAIVVRGGAAGVLSQTQLSGCQVSCPLRHAVHMHSRRCSQALLRIPFLLSPIPPPRTFVVQTRRLASASRFLCNCVVLCK